MFSPFGSICSFVGGKHLCLFTVFEFSSVPVTTSVTGQPAKMHDKDSKAATIRCSSPSV